MKQEPQLYHIFKVRIGKEYYKTAKVYTDDEFDRVMDSVGWCMPFNLSAYHFQSSAPPVCTNPVMNALPLIDCSVEDLLAGQVLSKTTLRDKQQKCLRKVYRKWGRFVVAKDDLSDGIYGKLLLLDEEHTLVSRLEPSPITLRAAKTYVDKYHRHNVAPQGHKFSIALITPIEEEPVGVVIASTPKSRIQAQGLFWPVDSVDGYLIIELAQIIP